MKVSSQVINGEGLAKLLNELPAAVASNAGSAALLAAAAVYQREMRRRVRKRTGSLAKAIKTKVLRARIKGRRTALIGISDEVYETSEGRVRPRNYAHLEEFGTAAHKIEAKNAPVLADQDGVYGKVVEVSASPNPFFRPALDTKAGEALAALAEGVGKGIRREGQRLRRKNMKENVRGPSR